MWRDDCRPVIVEVTAVGADEDGVTVCHLTLTGLPATLDHGLVQRGEGPQVEGRQLPAPGVRRQGPTKAELAVGDERPALAFCAETIVLERDEDGVGIAVVQLAD